MTGIDETYFVTTAAMVDEFLAKDTKDSVAAEKLYDQLDEHDRDFAQLTQKLYPYFSPEKQSCVIEDKLAAIEEWGSIEEVRQLERDFAIPENMNNRVMKAKSFIVYEEMKSEYSTKLLSNSNAIGPLVKNLEDATIFEKITFLEVATELKKAGKLVELHDKLIEKFAFSTAAQYAERVMDYPTTARRGAAWGLSEVFSVFAPDSKRAEVQALLKPIFAAEPK